MPESRLIASSLSLAIGSSLILPLVITNGSPTFLSKIWCSGVYGSITPRYFRFGATAWDTVEAGFHHISTIGLCGEVSNFSSASDTQQCLLASSVSATIMASGLNGRLFLWRSSLTGFSLVACQGAGEAR